MAKIKRIVVHCTAEPSNAKRSFEYYRHLFFDVYHWTHWGYHCIVYQDGTWEMLQPWPAAREDGGYIDSSTRANGATGYNNDSLHIAYVGGIDPVTKKHIDTRTRYQKATLACIITKWKHDYIINEVLGHNQLPHVRKACPCFDAKKEYENV